MKNPLKLIVTLSIILVLLAGCGFASAAAAGGSASDPMATPAATTQVPERDASGEYDEKSAVTLKPTDELTITKAGVYILSGSYEGMITVDAGDEDKVQIVLSNADLSNPDGPAIYVRNADKVFLTAAEGTENSISDGAEYTLEDGDTTLDAAVFSRGDPTINGAGKLTITGSSKHAVVSKDDLTVTAKDLTVSAQNVGLSGKDCVKISGANVTITAGSDGIRSDNDTDGECGYISAADSVIRVTAGSDGFQAVSSIEMDGCSCEIDAEDDAIHADGSAAIRRGSVTITIHADGKVEITGGTLDITGREGIEATYILISGGDITISATDDGINAGRKSSTYSPTVEITGGSLTITMGAGDTDGIDSNGDLIISGGTISVNAASAFDWDGNLSFTGGTVYINGQQVTTISNQMMGGGFGGYGGFPGQGNAGASDGGTGAAPDSGAFPGGQGGEGSFGGGHGHGKRGGQSA